MEVESDMVALSGQERRTAIPKSILRAMGGVYRAGSRLHRLIYDQMIEQIRLSIPVISVGNIIAGGSGKTPFVHYLTNLLRPKQVAILSRGYKRKSKKMLKVVEGMPFEMCGDEPKFLKRHLPEATVIVGKDRVHAGRLAAMLGSEIILLDDGFQHRRLYRDRDIVMMDGQNPFGEGHFLPYGDLRENPAVLARADLIVLLRVADLSHLEKVKGELAKWTNAPVMSMNIGYDNEKEIAGKRIGLFCAIARPRRLIEILQRLESHVVQVTLKPDHDPFSIEELRKIADSAKERGAELLVCTEKDAIKWSAFPQLSLPVIPLKMCLHAQFGIEHLERAIRGVV